MKRFLRYPRILLLASLLLLSQSGRAGEVFRDSCQLRFDLPLDSTTKYNLVHLQYYPVKRRKIALVLSGGGARGFAHLGVLKAFEEHHIPVNLIVGTSIGSIVGGLYAAGFNAEQILNIARQIDWNTIFSDETYRTNLFLSQKSIPRRHLLQLRFEGFLPYIPSSLTQGQKVLSLLYRYLLKANFRGNVNFDNLKIPFRAVATDLVSGKRVVLDHGDVAEAITASVSIPLLFAPVELDNMWLVDGGITDNIPVDVARELNADFIIAVDVTSPLRDKNDMAAPWEIADQVTTIMMKRTAIEHLTLADFVLQPPLEKYKAGDFQKIDSLVEVGYRYALQMMDSLKSRLNYTQNISQGDNQFLGKAAAVRYPGLSDSLRAFFRNTLKSRAGDYIYEADIYHDLLQFYRSGMFQTVYACVNGPFDAKEIDFFLKPFPKVLRLNIIHHQILPDSLIYAFLSFEPGFLLNMNAFSHRLDSLIDFYIQKDFALAEISAIEFDSTQNTLTIRINEGVIDSIQIEGNQRTLPFVIFREFPLKNGDIFRSDLALEGIDNIYSTGLFDKVLLNLKKRNGKNILIIKVKEKKYLLMRLGAHGSLERKSEGMVELLEDNLFGSATKLSINASIGELVRKAEFSLYTFRLFNTYLTYRLHVFYNERWDRYYPDLQTRIDYQLTRRGIYLSVGQQIEKLGLISAELRAETVDIFATSAAFPYGDRYQVRSFALRSVVDKRDQLPFPRKGIYNRWFWETGNQFLLGSSFSFTRIFLGLEGYYPFMRYFNYHPFIQAGTADLTLPFSEFFAFGGQDQFPGLYEREKLGRQFALAGVDLRMQVPWSFPVESYLKLGYAIGATWQKPDDKISSNDFLKSIHFSVAVNSLLGPIVFTYGNVPNYRSLIYLSIGYNF